MCCGVASVSVSMMQHWLLRLELWHEINGTPWCGHSTLRCAVKVMHPSLQISITLLTFAKVESLLAPITSWKACDPMMIQHLNMLHTHLDLKAPLMLPFSWLPV